MMPHPLRVSLCAFGLAVLAAAGLAHCQTKVINAPSVYRDGKNRAISVPIVISADSYVGADMCAQINAAVTVLAAAGLTGGVVQVPAGSYNCTTTIGSASNTTVEGMGAYATTLNWTGVNTGTLVNISGAVGFRFRHIGLNTSQGNTTTAISVATGTQTEITDVKIAGGSSTTGFCTGIQITGDGVSTSSNTTWINQVRMDNYICTGLAINHAVDTFISDGSWFSSVNNATVVNLSVDTGTSGLYVQSTSTGYGLHGLLVQHANTGGAYGAAPVYLFFDQFLADTTTGGDAYLFASTLSTNITSAVFTNCWAAAAGLNNVGAVVTTGSNGITLAGGQGVTFDTCRIRDNVRNGIAITSANVAQVTISNSLIVGNNVENNADGHGVYETAAATRVGIIGNRIGNVLDTGGHQKFGVKIAAVNATGLRVLDNDLSDNATGALSDANTGVSTTWNYPGDLRFDGNISLETDITNATKGLYWSTAGNCGLGCIQRDVATGNMQAIPQGNFGIGSTGVEAQFTTGGVLAQYNNIATVEKGVAASHWNGSATAQAANISGTNIIASATAARYRLSCYIAVTQQATTSSTVPDCNLICTDPTDSVAKTIQVTPAINGVAVNPGTGVGVSGVGICDAKASTAVQYSTTGYNSVGATALQYKIYFILEQM